jgi:CRP-like cAMP-binding protein
MLEKSNVLSVMDLIIALKQIPVFASVHGEGLKRLSDAIREMRVSSGELIFAEHELGEEMYVVYSGKIRIYHETGGHEEVLDLVGPGGYFGEMAIIDEQPRSASARASDDTTLLVLHKNDFRSAVRDYPDIAFEVLKEFVRRLRQADQRIRSLAGELAKKQVEAQ